MDYTGDFSKKRSKTNINLEKIDGFFQVRETGG